MIYLDNAATTKVDDRVIEKMNKYMRESYANPSSLHSFGFNVESDINKETKDILKYLQAPEGSVLLWTSGGTESNNMAIREVARWKVRAGKHILSTKYEHPSVSKTLDRLKDYDFEIEYVDIDKDGHVDINDLKRKLRPDTILVSIMFVNNEIGAVNNIDAIADVIKNYNKDIVFHVDGIQAFGKYRFNLKKTRIDLLSASGHKINGPKGIGFLYISPDTKIKALIEGGGQQDNLRSGTLNTPGIIGMAEASRIIYDNFDDIDKKVRDLNKYFLESIKDKKYFAVSKTAIGTMTELDYKPNYSPYIVSIVFPNVRSEVMLHALEEKEIYVGAGSACGSHKKHESEALKAINIDKDNMDKVVRFSLSRYNIKDEIDVLIKALDANYEKLSRFIRK